MKISTRKTAGISLGFALTMLVVMPSIADDTELLLVAPDESELEFRANILFIIDSSGSMRTLESSTTPYDSSIRYEGACDTSKLYWTQIDIVPACGESNAQFFSKTAYVCLESSRQLTSVGRYSDVMAQHRANGDESIRWTTLEAGNASDLVECLEDSGLHGSDSSRVFAQTGSGMEPFTDDPVLEIAWGSYPASEIYTVYDGNYLNWRSNPAPIERSRLEIVKTASKTALASIDDVNVGIMRFNGLDGGVVMLAVTPLGSNRDVIDGVIDAIQPDDYTPIAETAYEAALYWLGAPAYYGEITVGNLSDPDAFSIGVPATYLAPESPACTRNYNVLLTDGEATRDLDAQTLAPTLPNFFEKLGRDKCTGTAMGDCLDDITQYLSIADINPQQPGNQYVTTHTIGFKIDLPILKQAAEVSGGDYYLADDVENLTLALLEIFDTANKRGLSFTAPSVAVNTFNRTQNRNELFMSVFSAESRLHWPGNLKKYGISGGAIVDADGAEAIDPLTGFFKDSARSFWTTGEADGSDVRQGGAANLLPDPLTRRLFTNNGADDDLTAGSNAVSVMNEAAFTLEDLGLSGAPGEPTRAQLIDWARGADLLDEDNDPTTTQRFAMGDPLHASPAAVDYGTSPEAPDTVVYVATNDGYLHAIDGASGNELWSFIPKELLSRLARLYFDPSSKYKTYGLDGDVVPVVGDRNNNGIIDGDDFVYLLFGMRRGGDTYYALDVTDKEAPKLLWETTLPGFGQTWAAPIVVRVNIDDAALNADKAVVIVGGGYDPRHDTPSYPTAPDAEGAGIYMLDLQTGAVIWRAGADAGADLTLPQMTRAIPNTLTVIDLDGNRIADRIYAADVGGQLWRFDLFPGRPPESAVAGGVIAQLGAEGEASAPSTGARRVYNSPDVALFEDPVENRRFLSVSIGTGYRAHPLNTDAIDRFYSFRDENVFTRLTQTELDNYAIATDTDFVDVSGAKNVVVRTPARGWKLTLPADEMVLSDSRTFDGQVFFVTFSPEQAANAACEVRVGRNFLYAVSVINGDPLVNNLDTLFDADIDEARRTPLQQGGIAPTPQFLFPSADEDCEGADCNPPPIGCVGVECFAPGFDPRPVRTLWTQDGIE